jgi:outer membrane immunogenic protein
MITAHFAKMNAIGSSSGAVMKKLLFAGIALAAMIGGPAMAADLGAPVYTYAPVASWTGFYIGGDIGWFDARQNATTTPYPFSGFGTPAVAGMGAAGLGNLPTVHTLDGKAALGGVHAGYNWQVGSLLYGLEGDVVWLNYHPSDAEAVFETLSPTPAPAFTMLVSAQNRWLASARGRLGWVVGPVLLYSTAGMAFSNSSYTATATGVVGPATPFLAGTGATISWYETKTGYVVGGGAEWMATPNWLVRAEYLHYGFDSTTSFLPLVFSATLGGCAQGACYWGINSSRMNIDTVRVGLSYKFDAPAASPARK